jgi:hypothetical protein
VSRVADLILDAMEAEVRSRTEWDEAPCLYFLSMSGGGCEVRPQAVPEDYWGMAPPGRVLAALADGLGQFSGLLQSTAPEGLYGAAFRCEMWEVRTGPPGAPDHDRAQAMADERRLREHPDRVETRSIWAVDRGGISYDVTLERESGDLRRLVTYPKPGVPGFTGIIPAALDRLVTALLGVELAARPR